MSTPDQNKAGGKSGQRNRKRKQQGSQKPDQPQSVKADQPRDARELIDAAIASTDTASTDAAIASTDASPTDAAIASTDTSPTGAPAPVDPTPTAAAVPVDPIGLQTIATAYRDYTRKSFAEAQSFVEKLSSVRSLDKALEVQSEFAKQAYETFVTDSRKIRTLYGELVKQTFQPPKPAPRERRDG